MIVFIDPENILRSINESTDKSNYKSMIEELNTFIISNKDSKNIRSLEFSKKVLESIVSDSLFNLDKIIPASGNLTNTENSSNKLEKTEVSKNRSVGCDLDCNFIMNVKGKYYCSKLNRFLVSSDTKRRPDNCPLNGGDEN